MNQRVVRIAVMILATAIALVLVACGGTATEPGVEETPTVEATPESTEVPIEETDEASEEVVPDTVDASDITPLPLEEGTPRQMPEPGVPDPKAAMVHEVKMDLAQQLGVDVSEVQEVQAEEVEWSDSSLGCPAPGHAYAQVITPGYQITLEADGKTFTYHTDRDEHFVLCGANRQPVEDLDH